MILIKTGKYKEPKIRIKHGFYFDEKIEYKYFVRILVKTIPITGKEYSVMNNILDKWRSKC